LKFRGEEGGGKEGIGAKWKGMEEKGREGSFSINRVKSV